MRCISFVVSFAEIAIIGIDCVVCLMVRPAHCVVDQLTVLDTFQPIRGICFSKMCFLWVYSTFQCVHCFKRSFY